MAKIDEQICPACKKAASIQAIIGVFCEDCGEFVMTEEQLAALRYYLERHDNPHNSRTAVYDNG